MKNTCGIYCFIHRDTGRCYVGSSTNVARRFRSHVSDIKKCGTSFFHRSARELGIESFDFELVERCDKSNLLEKEKFWISFFDCIKKGFNTSPNPFAHYPDSVSEITRKRISESLKGRKATLEQRIARSIARKGFKHSLETRLKIANAHKFTSVETRAKLSEASKGNKGRGKGNPFTPEHRANLSRACTGRKLSEETKRKLSGIKKGIPLSEETKAKLRAAHARRRSSALN